MRQDLWPTSTSTLSWNFKHIVNYSRIRGFNSVNIRMGYRAMTILSPREVGDEEEDI